MNIFAYKCICLSKVQQRKKKKKKRIIQELIKTVTERMRGYGDRKGSSTSLHVPCTILLGLEPYEDYIVIRKNSTKMWKTRGKRIAGWSD